MATPHPIKAAIFDMDGLLIDSEPLWLQAELDVFTALGLDTSSRDTLPDTLGLRIDLVVAPFPLETQQNGRGLCRQ